MLRFKKIISLVLILAMILPFAAFADKPAWAANPKEVIEAMPTKDDLKEIRKTLQKAIRGRYALSTLEEFDDLKFDLAKEYSDIAVLSVDSIISHKYKFDFKGMLPVIKSGRTLIPVRAITEGLGAELVWDGDARTVLIWMDDNNNDLLDEDETDILLTIDSNIAFVDGEAVLMDTKATIMNNRTIVPLRFISEVFKLKVDWNEEDRTIEINPETPLTITGEDMNIALLSIISDTGERTTGAAIIIPETTTGGALELALSVPTIPTGWSFEMQDENGDKVDFTDAPLSEAYIIVVTDPSNVETVYLIRFNKFN